MHETDASSSAHLDLWKLACYGRNEPTAYAHGMAIFFLHVVGSLKKCSCLCYKLDFYK